MALLIRSRSQLIAAKMKEKNYFPYNSRRAYLFGRKQHNHKTNKQTNIILILHVLKVKVRHLHAIGVL